MPIPRKQYPEQSWLGRFQRSAKLRTLDISKRLESSGRDVESQEPVLQITELDNLETLKIQTIPMSLSVEPKADWAIIPVLGRNNPFYHYVGGEDTLSIVLDWYSVAEDRQDVAQKCRLLESWSRSDGWVVKPPRVKVTWGKLFETSAWIITAAPYEFSRFDKGFELFPLQAYQRLELKKVTEFNTTQLQRKSLN